MLEEPRYEPLAVADLVRHKGREGSFGHIDSMTPLSVVWNLNGYVAPVWGEGRYSEPEFGLSLDDLAPVTCPGCGEGQCWCGVGR